MSKWLDIIKAIAPIVTAIAVPGPGGMVLGGLIAHGIQSAEELKDASGPDKLAHAVDIINTSVSGINAVHPNTIDPALVQDTVPAVIDAVIKTANLVKNTPPKH